jgi:soluble lytic murein transglycosylase
VRTRVTAVLAFAIGLGWPAPRETRPAFAQGAEPDGDVADLAANAGAGQRAEAARASNTKRRPPAKVAFDPTWLEPFFKSGAAKPAAEHFRDEDWAAAEAGFSRAAKALPRASAERRAARYLLALAQASQSKWAEAGALFEDLYATYPRLAAYHAYGAARCRLRRGDAAGALEWSGRVPEGSVLEADTSLVRIDALRALGRWEDAAAAIQAYLDRFPGGPRRAEALFKKGEALEKLGAGSAAAGRPDLTADATAAYRRAWAEAPLEPWGDRATERITALARELPPYEAELVRTHVASEWVARGMVLYDKNRNAESEAAFAAALSAAGLDRDLECRARFHRAQSVWKQRQRARAAPLFDEAEAACARAGNADLGAKSLYQAGRSYAAMKDRVNATARYARVEAEHAESSYADDARLRTAELATDAGDEAAAVQLLTEIPARYPKGDMVNEALWRLAFAAWRAGRYDDALRWLDENLRLIPHEEIWYAEGRVQYWKGRIFERQSQPALARDWYERAVREYPLSVYALLALQRLQESSPKARAALLGELRPKHHRPASWSFAARPLFGEAGFLRAVELARLGLGSDARRELARLGLATAGDSHPPSGARAEDEDLLWITAILLDRGGLWSASHSIPRYTVTRYRLSYPREMGQAKWMLSYPRAYAALVTKDSRANQIPEALQLAIMREESAFNPRIESFANAIGLTQLLLKTAKRFANNAPVTRDSLMDPAKNLEIGARYLGFLWKHFGGAAPLVIAGYNAGEGAVDRWLADHPELAVDELLETIPYDETRNYTKRVLASYFAYAWLYADRPVPEIPLTLPGHPVPRTADKR